MIKAKPWLLFAVTFVLATIAGSFLYKDALLWGDSLNMFSPYPLLEMVQPTYVPPQTIFDYIGTWFSQTNGRLTQAILCSFVFAYSKAFVPSVLDFPAWILRTGSLIAMIFSCYLVGAIVLKLSKSLRYATLLTLGVAGFWLFNNTNLYVNNIFDVLVIGYCLPILTTLHLFYIFAFTNYAAKPITLFACFIYYVLVSLFTEHSLIAVLMLSIFGILLNSENQNRIKRIVLHIGFSCLATALSAVVFFSSPGQRWRMGVVNQSRDFSPSHLFHWYVDSLKYSYSMLVPASEHWGKELVVVHSIVLASVVLIIANRFISPRTSRYLDDPILKAALVSACLLATFHGCMSTQLLSTYLPFWAMQYPTMFLAAGWACFLCLCFQLLQGKKVALVLSASLFACLALNMSFQIVPIKNGFTEIRVHDQMRRKLFVEFPKQLSASGGKAFVLRDFPKTRHGFSIEPSWGLAAFLRWQKIEGVTLIEENELAGQDQSSYATLTPKSLKL